MFVAVGARLETRMRHIVMWPLGIYYVFSHYTTNEKIFEKKKDIEQKMRVSIFSTTLSETFLILRRKERDMIKDIYWC